MPCVIAVDTRNALPRARRAHKGRDVDRHRQRSQVWSTVHETNGEQASPALPALDESPKAAAAAIPHEAPASDGDPLGRRGRWETSPQSSSPGVPSASNAIIRAMPEGFT